MSDNDQGGEGSFEQPSQALTAPNASMELPEVFRWFTAEFNKVHKKPIERLRLLRRGPEGGSVHVYSWTPDDFAAGPQTLFEEIYEKAMNDARLQPGKVPFMLQISYQDRKHEDISQVFEMQGARQRDGEDVFGGESATPKGLVAQQMRHNEAILRLALLSSREGMQTLARQNEDKDRQITQLLSMHIQVLDLHSRLKDKEFERELEREDKKSMRNLKTGLLEEGIKQLPAVLQMFAKPAGQADEYIKQMMGLFDLLGEDGINRMIQGLLAPDPATGQPTPENMQKAQALHQMVVQLLQAREAAAKPPGT